MWTLGARLTACNLDINSVNSIQDLLNNIQLLKRSCNAEAKWKNITFKSIDIPTIVYITILLFKPFLWCQKKSLEHSETKYGDVYCIISVIKFHNNLTNRLSKTAKND